MAEKPNQIECKKQNCKTRGGWVESSNGEKFYCHKNIHDGNKNHVVKRSLKDVVEFLGYTPKEAIDLLALEK